MTRPVPTHVLAARLAVELETIKLHVAEAQKLIKQITESS